MEFWWGGTSVSRFHTKGVTKQLKMHRARESLTSSLRCGGSEDREQQQLTLGSVFKQHEKFHNSQNFIDKCEFWESTGAFGVAVKFSRTRTHETESVPPEQCETFILAETRDNEVIMN